LKIKIVPVQKLRVQGTENVQSVRHIITQEARRQIAGNNKKKRLLIKIWKKIR